VSLYDNYKDLSRMAWLLFLAFSGLALFSGAASPWNHDLSDLAVILSLLGSHALSVHWAYNKIMAQQARIDMMRVALGKEME
jgi:hypothetical protein